MDSTERYKLMKKSTVHVDYQNETTCKWLRIGLVKIEIKIPSDVTTQPEFIFNNF